jgi:hypothetical protein
MSLSERHRWCVKKILEVFQPELESETVQQFIRNESNLNYFTSFFRGDNSGRLFVFYQPVVTEGDEVSQLLSNIIILLFSLYSSFYTTSINILLSSFSCRDMLKVLVPRYCQFQMATKG